MKVNQTVKGKGDTPADRLKELLVPLLAVVFAFIVGAVFIKFSGKSIIESYYAMVVGATSGFGETLVKTTPLIFCGLSVAFAFRCGLFNIGAPGQFLMGAVAGAFIGYAIELPLLLHIPLCLLAAIICGGLWGGLAGYLKARFGSHEVITTIMLNFIALKFTEYLVNSPLRDPGGIAPMTPKIHHTAELFRLPGYGRLSLAIFIALAAAFFIYYLLNRTTTGYEVRAVGFNPLAAEYGGISVSRNIVLAMFISGSLAGLAGCCEVMGTFRFFTPEIAGDYGFEGIAVALLAANNPLGVIISALLFGALSNGAIAMQALAETPKQIASIVQGLVIMFVAADQLVRFFLPGIKEKRKKKK